VYSSEPWERMSGRRFAAERGVDMPVCCPEPNMVSGCMVAVSCGAANGRWMAGGWGWKWAQAAAEGGNWRPLAAYRLLVCMKEGRKGGREEGAFARGRCDSGVLEGAFRSLSQEVLDSHRQKKKLGCGRSIAQTSSAVVCGAPRPPHARWAVWRASVESGQLGAGVRVCVALFVRRAREAQRRCGRGRLPSGCPRPYLPVYAVRERSLARRALALHACTGAALHILQLMLRCPRKPCRAETRRQGCARCSASQPTRAAQLSCLPACLPCSVSPHCCRAPSCRSGRGISSRRLDTGLT
jgi:hypothetical protein